MTQPPWLRLSPFGRGRFGGTIALELDLDGDWATGHFHRLNFPRGFRELAYHSPVLLRVPQHEAQWSAVHRGDGGTP